MAKLGYAGDDEPEDLDAIEAQALQEQRQAALQLSPDEILRKAHKALLADLLAKAELGVMTHQEQAILRNMLRDNGMVMGVAPEGMQPGVEKPRELPTFDDGEYEHA